MSKNLNRIVSPYNPELVIEYKDNEYNKTIEKVELFKYFYNIAIPKLYKKIYIDNIKTFTKSLIHEKVDNSTNPIQLKVPFIKLSNNTDSLLTILHFFYWGFANSSKSLNNRQDLYDIINSVKFFMKVITI